MRRSGGGDKGDDEGEGGKSVKPGVFQRLAGLIRPMADERERERMEREEKLAKEEQARMAVEMANRSDDEDEDLGDQEENEGVSQWRRDERKHVVRIDDEDEENDFVLAMMEDDSQNDFSVRAGAPWNLLDWTLLYGTRLAILGLGLSGVALAATSPIDSLYSFQGQGLLIANLFLVACSMAVFLNSRLEKETTFLHRNARLGRRMSVTLHDITAIMTEGGETPMQLTEKARRREYWPNGEYVRSAVLEESMESFWGCERQADLFRPLEIDGMEQVMGIHAGYHEWKRVCDHIRRKLYTIFPQGQLLRSMGIETHEEEFQWVLVSTGAKQSLDVILVNSSLIFHIEKFDMSWERLVNEYGEYAGCKLSKRRDDGEWEGLCGGHRCVLYDHWKTKQEYNSVVRILSRRSASLFRRMQQDNNLTFRVVMGSITLSVSKSAGKYSAKSRPWNVHKWKSA